MKANIHHCTLALAASALLLGSVDSAFAATANSTVTFDVPVNNPTCTVSNAGAAVTLPTVASPTVTIAQWQAAAGLTTAGAGTFSAWKTAAALNQLVTITCDRPSVSISGVIVRPASMGGQPPITALKDSASSPNLAGLDMLVGYEQVSPAAYAYYPEGNAYTGTMTTNTDPTSTATFVWRPVFSIGTPSNSIGNPTGGSFNTTAEIVVNY